MALGRRPPPARQSRAEQLLQVLHAQPQSPNPPTPSQPSTPTVYFFGGAGGSVRLPLQSNVTAQSVVLLKPSPLFPAHHLQPVFHRLLMAHSATEGRAPNPGDPPHMDLGGTMSLPTQTPPFRHRHY